MNRITILLVEDDADDVHFMERAFKKADLEPPRVVKDGQEAVEYLSGSGAYGDRALHPTPSLLLLDLKLPRRSGHEVLAWLKAQPILRRIPVIVLTSSRETSDINRAFEAGASSYLAKPVEMADLQSMVQSIKAYWLLLNRFPDLPAVAP